MRDTRGWLAIVVLLAALGLAGCGGDDDGDAASDAPDAGAVGGDDVLADSGSGGVDESDGSNSDSGDVAGDDFPIPAPDGLVLDALADAGIPLDSQRQLFYENDDFDRVVMFYDDWTSENGEWSRGEAEGTVVYQRLDGEAIGQISISPDHDPGAQADGPVTVVLLVAG